MASLESALAAGWRVFEQDGKNVAEKSLSLPGQTATLIREEAESLKALAEKIEVREKHLGGDVSQPPKVVITDTGQVVTGDQHEALKTDGVALATPAPPEVPEFDGTPELVSSETNDGTDTGDGTDTPDPSPSVPADAAPSSQEEPPATPPAEPDPEVSPDVTPDPPLTDEERAAVQANEAELEASLATPPPEA